MNGCQHKRHVTLVARQGYETPRQWIWCGDCGCLITPPDVVETGILRPKSLDLLDRALDEEVTDEYREAVEAIVGRRVVPEIPRYEE